MQRVGLSTGSPQGEDGRHGTGASDEPARGRRGGRRRPPRAPAAWPCGPHAPALPSGHMQEKEATRSMQVDPGVQEAKAQSSMFSLQSSPLQPLTHTQP